MSTEPIDAEAPVKRLRLELTMDAHNLNDLRRQMRILADELDYEGREEREVVSSSGYFLTLKVRSDLTEEQWTDQIIAWGKVRREARRALSQEQEATESEPSAAQ